VYLPTILSRRDSGSDGGAAAGRGSVPFLPIVLRDRLEEG